VPDKRRLDPLTDVSINPATEADAARLNEALGRLSAEIGDRHLAKAEDILRHGFGPSPAFRALLAERANAVVGTAVFSPVFSTTRAAAGLYVSDLWVAQEARGLGLGRRLLASAHALAAQEWGAAYLKLAVYDDNPTARAFYTRLGFIAEQREAYLTLQGADLGALKEEP
jgi:GNAT superfamily N-acetyltransferase